MTKQLFFRAICKFALGILLIGALLFLPAGTLAYPGAWRLMGVLFLPMLIVGIVLMAQNPELLRKRLKAKEAQTEQRLVVLLSGLMFVGGFVVAALDFRFGWLVLPDAVPYIAAGVFLFAYGLYAEVMRENVYLSRTVEVQENQRVIDTGLYGVVRHPMYSATLLLFWAIPLVLGSVIALGVFFVYPFLLVKRIKNEEAVLEAELAGYAEYKQKVKYRLIPFVW